MDKRDSVMETMETSNQYQVLDNEETIVTEKSEKTNEVRKLLPQNRAKKQMKQSMPPIVVQGRFSVDQATIKRWEKELKLEDTLIWKFNSRKTILHTFTVNDHTTMKAKCQELSKEFFTYSRKDEKTHAFILYVPAPAPEKLAWNMKKGPEREPLRGTQEPPRGHSDRNEGIHERRSEVRNQNQPRRIQNTVGSPPLPYTPPPNVNEPLFSNNNIGELCARVDELSQMVNLSNVLKLVNGLIQLLNNTPGNDREREVAAFYYMLNAKNSGLIR
ncbi:hypothetical protein JTB14_014005 [Gonioctena quinquepunctata]|nr:hypothetical protein JTB14_014005 [Gonioctena quinquepunctata]